MTLEQQNFINSIYKALCKYAPMYSIKCYSAIIGQAILESGWGKSKLASSYHNYFGLKCGSYWKGKSVNMETFEEYNVGTLTQINDNFRVFDDLDSGVKGYLDFINTSRYSNLKNVTSPQEYLQNIKNDGYATSSTYVDNVMNIVTTYNLTSYDTKISKTLEEIVQEVIAGKWGNGEERKTALTKAGYDYNLIQSLVNTSLKKSNEEIAREVIAGKWGNGNKRIRALTKAGYDYETIRAIVNKSLKGY